MCYASKTMNTTIRASTMTPNNASTAIQTLKTSECAFHPDRSEETRKSSNKTAKFKKRKKKVIQIPLHDDQGDEKEFDTILIPEGDELEDIKYDATKLSNMCCGSPNNSSLKQRGLRGIQCYNTSGLKFIRYLNRF